MIENIFIKNSKQPKKENPQLIEIDFRERNSLVPVSLKSLNHQIKIKELKVGDYLVNNTIIERKEIKDLVQSIKNKRIFKQIIEMKQYKKRLLIIEGNIYAQKNLSPNSIKGFILSTTINKKIPTICTQSPLETARYISILANKKKTNSSTNPYKKNLSFQERQKFILQSFPDIGPKTSKKLLEAFGSLKNIFNTEGNELKPFLKKKTSKFLNQLN